MLIPNLFIWPQHFAINYRCELWVQSNFSTGYSCFLQTCFSMTHLLFPTIHLPSLQPFMLISTLISKLSFSSSTNFLAYIPLNYYSNLAMLDQDDNNDCRCIFLANLLLSILSMRPLSIHLRTVSPLIFFYSESSSVIINQYFIMLSIYNISINNFRALPNEKARRLPVMQTVNNCFNKDQNNLFYNSLANLNVHENYNSIPNHNSMHKQQHHRDQLNSFNLK